MDTISEKTVAKLISSGMDASAIAKALEVPITVIQSIVLAWVPEYSKSPEDDSLAEEYRDLERLAIRKTAALINTLPPAMNVRLLSPLIRSAAMRVGKATAPGDEQDTRNELEKLMAAMRNLEPKAVGE